MDGPYIQMRKTLRTDGRVSSLAAKLQESLRDKPLPESVFRAAAIGGLFLLWCLGDEHGESLRGLSKAGLDLQVGIPGFSDALPSEWLQERVTLKSGNAVKSLHLPNYVRKNESTERTRSLTRERVRRFRERQKEGGNGVTSLHDPPDQTSQAQTRVDQNKPPTGDDARALEGYAREVVGLGLQKLVGKTAVEVLVDFGLAGVVELLEHLASRRPSERFKGARSIIAVCRSLLTQAEQGTLPREHDFETFAAWRARRSAEIAVKTGARV